MKIAIFGGSFNPVHKEHLNLINEAKHALDLDKIIVIPSNITPNKGGRLTASGTHRLNMCRLAFEGLDGVEVSDFELKQGGISFSYMTCRAFRQKYPADELYFIIGADMLENFPLWKNPEEILKCVTLAVCARNNTDSLCKAESVFKKNFNADIVKFSYVGGNVSSTKIRTLAALGESIKEYVPEKTQYYIEKNNLYSLPNIMRVKEYLTPERWAHSVRVALMSAENCSRIGVSEIKAITAAALHDCAKYLKCGCPELKDFVCPSGVPAPVIHQYAGAFVAERVFGINDGEILDAIKYHTSGKPDMQPLGKLLYLCDMLEEGRDFEGVQELREIFSRDIDKALYASLKHQVDYLNRTGKTIYPLTQKSYEYLKEIKND